MRILDTQGRDVITPGAANITPVKNATPLLISGYNIDVATSPPGLLELSGTWNNSSATPTAIKLAISDANSNVASLLMDLQAGSPGSVATKWNCDKAGNVLMTGILVVPAGSAGNPSIQCDSAGIWFPTPSEKNVAIAGGAVEWVRITTRNRVGIGLSSRFTTLSVCPAADNPLSGGTTVANNTTSIAGTNTYFTSDIVVGDRISLSSASTTYATVIRISSDTLLTVDTPLGDGTTQTINVKRSAFAVIKTGDSEFLPNVVIDDRGRLLFYDVTNHVFDVNLYRSAANTLKTDATSFLVGGNDLTIVDDARVLQSRLPNVATTITLTSNTAYFVYLGRTIRDITVKFVEFYVNNSGSGTQNAEVGLFSTPASPNKAGQTLTKLIADATLDALNSGGVKRNTTAFNSGSGYVVPAGTHLWAGIRTAMTTNQPSLSGLCMDFSEGLVLSKTTAGALTASSSFAGSVVTPGTYLNTALAPDLRVTLD